MLDANAYPGSGCGQVLSELGSQGRVGRRGSGEEPCYKELALSQLQPDLAFAPSAARSALPWHDIVSCRRRRNCGININPLDACRECQELEEAQKREQAQRVHGGRQ